MSARAWGFKSPLAHPHRVLHESGALQFPKVPVRRQVWPGFVVVAGRRLAGEVVSPPLRLRGGVLAANVARANPAGRYSGRDQPDGCFTTSQGSWCSSRRVLRDVFFGTCSSGGSTAGPPRLQDSGVPGLLALEGPGRGLCSVRRPGRRVDPVPFEDDRLFVAATSNPMKMVRTTGSVPVVTSLGLPGCRGARGVAAPRDRANMDHALFVARGRRSSSASNDPRRSCRYSVRNRHRGYHCGSGHAARREEPRHRITG